MTVAALWFAIDRNILLQLRLLNSALICDLIENIVLKLLEGELLGELIDDALVTAEDEAILARAHVERADILGDVDFIWLGHECNRHAPRADELCLNHRRDGSLQVHSLVQVAT